MIDFRDCLLYLINESFQIVLSILLFTIISYSVKVISKLRKNTVTQEIKNTGDWKWTELRK
jgi:hypothetical protein